jgi:AraC-like DNA-binding protein
MNGRSAAAAAPARGEDGATGAGCELFASEVVSVGYVRCAVDHPAFTRRALVSGHRLVFPRYGVWIQVGRTARYVSDASVVEYYNDGDQFSRVPLDPRGDRTEWYGVAEPILRDIVRRYDPAAADGPQPFRRTHGPTDSHACAIQRALCRRIVLGQPVDALEVEEAVLEILDQVLACAHARRRPPMGPVTRNEREMAERASSVLSQRTTTRPGLSVIARESGVSVFHLSRVFRKVTGRTLAKHHLQLRLMASLDALLESGISIRDIAAHHGFAGHSHYSSVFRRVFGVAPSDFRRMPARALRSTMGPVRKLASQA